jgi:hypothetical protein
MPMSAAHTAASLLLLLGVTACSSRYDGGGRRKELPNGQGGISIDVSTRRDSGSGAPARPAPCDETYRIETGVLCVADAGQSCERRDGVTCVCNFVWSCRGDAP